jgi:hypothetical protein
VTFSRRPGDYQRPNRLSRVLRSGALYWSGFAVVVVLVIGLMTLLT